MCVASAVAAAAAVDAEKVRNKETPQSDANKICLFKILQGKVNMYVLHQIFIYQSQSNAMDKIECMQNNADDTQVRITFFRMWLLLSIYDIP